MSQPLRRLVGMEMCIGVPSLLVDFVEVAVQKAFVVDHLAGRYSYIELADGHVLVAV